MDKHIEIWKLRRLIKSLDTAKGGGTSMISLIIHPKDQISRVSKMLVNELGTASNIKSRTNRLSVVNAITSVQQRLKLYTKVPTNGLVIYCGTVMTDTGKEKRIIIDLEPPSAINTSLYLCDNKFHTEALSELLANEHQFGFIIIDGHGTLFGTLQGNARKVLHKLTVDLPKRHGRGGQSALRFARLRVEKRGTYLKKIATMASQVFEQVNLVGLIIAGSADLKAELASILDPKLQNKVLKLVNITDGGESGFNQAIELSAEVLSNVRLIHEKQLLQRYLSEIDKNTGKICFGTQDTFKALEMGAVEVLICWEHLDIVRHVMPDKILYLTPKQEPDLTPVESMPLLEWLVDNHANYGTALELVSDQSPEGQQYTKGFGGIGGILRYPIYDEAD